MGQIVIKLDLASPGLLELVKLSPNLSKEELLNYKNSLISEVKKLEDFTNTRIVSHIIGNKLYRDVYNGIIAAPLYDGEWSKNPFYDNLAKKALANLPNDIEIVLYCYHERNDYIFAFKANGITTEFCRLEGDYLADLLGAVMVMKNCVHNAFTQRRLYDIQTKTVHEIWYDRLYYITHEVLGNFHIPVERKNILNTEESVKAWIE